MSDLSLLSSLMPEGAARAPTDAPQAAPAFAWPMPALATYPVPAPQSQPEPCEIEGAAGQQLAGQMTGLDPVQGLVHVLMPGEPAPLPLQLAQLRRLTLTRPIAPLAPAGPPGVVAPASVLATAVPQAFTVQGGGGAVTAGQTIGHLVHGLGLFVFPPVPGGAAPGAVQRTLFPRATMARFDIGAPLGEVLVQQSAVTPAQVDEAVAAQKRQRSRKLGELLVAHRVVTMEQLFAALDKQARLPMMKLGDALVALGHVTEDELVEALRRQDHDRRQPLGALLEQRGLVGRAEVQQALAQKLGFPLVDVTHFPRDPGLRHALPAPLAQRLLALPLAHCGGRIVVAFPDPSQAAAVAEVEAALGGPVAPVLAAEDSLREILAGHAGADAAIPAQRAAPPADPRLPGAGAAPAARHADGAGAAAPVPAADAGDAGAAADADLAALAAVLLQAGRQGATDVHLEHPADAPGLQVRWRRDARLEAAEPLSGSPALLARLMGLAGLAPKTASTARSGLVSVARLVGAGIRTPWPAGAMLQVTAVPLHDGRDHLVIRLPSRLRLRRLDQITLASRDHARLVPLLDRPGGLIVVAAPARSGRTSTLHAMLDHVAAPHRSAYAVEPRLQIAHPTVRTLAVGPRAIEDTATALETLRQGDADVVLVDDLPDAAAVRAALALAGAGTLVLAGMAGRCAAEAAARLATLGGDPCQVADTLLGVHAQRLVPRLCSHCRMSRPAKEAEIDEWLDAWLEQGVPGDVLAAPTDEAGPPDPRATLLQDWIARRGRDGRLKRYHGNGCPQCRGTGRRSLAAVHEVLVVTREMRRLIRAHAPAWHLQRLALREGMRTLRQDAIDKMLAGVLPAAELRALADLVP